MWLDFEIEGGRVVLNHSFIQEFDVCDDSIKIWTERRPGDRSYFLVEKEKEPVQYDRVLRAIGHLERNS